MDEEVPQKIRTCCQECGHKHRENVYCHCYTEADTDEDPNDVISETESEDSESEDDSMSLSIAKKADIPQGKKFKKMKPLFTPSYVKNAGYIRCNCREGVPENDIKFQQLPRYIFVEDIQIQTYNEIMDHTDRNRYRVAFSKKYSEFQKLQMEEERKIRFSSAVPVILSFLPLGQCSHSACVNSYWYRGALQYTEYVNMRNCYPWQAFRPHQGQVESIFIKGNHIFTGGDKRMLVSELSTGELLSLVTRDSGEMPYLMQHEGDIFLCSSNGSIRAFTITGTGRNLTPNGTMWDHSRSVTQTICDLPTEGPCEAHGVQGHICHLFSSSQDRTIKVWDIVKKSLITSINAPTLRYGTFLSISQSRIHIFAGTSNSTIAVFNKTGVCERRDVHACNIPGRDKRYCLQLTIQLPKTETPSGNPASVYGLICTGWNYSFTHLWAGDSTGQLTVWTVPQEGLDFQPAHTVKAHASAINKLVSTWRHCISISDDGCIIFFDLIRFDKVRRIDICEWAGYRHLLIRPHVPRKIKCVHLYEDAVNGGMLAAGTSFGDVVVLSLGTTI